MTTPAGTPAGTTAAPRVRASSAVFPRVNLLPADVRESSRLRAVQAALGGGVLATAAAVALVAAGVAADASAARDELVAAQATNAGIQAQAAELAHVRDVYAQVEAAEAAVQTARAAEVPWSRLLNDLSLTIPDGVWVDSLTVAPAASTPGQTAASYGTISYTGRGRSHDDVAAWLEVLAGQPTLADATFTTSAKDQAEGAQTVTFSSTATVTAAALATRPEAS